MAKRVLLLYRWPQLRRSGIIEVCRRREGLILLIFPATTHFAPSDGRAAVAHVVHHSQLTMSSLTPPATPLHEWPEHRDLPEKTDPAHGEGSGESPSMIGVGASGIYTNVSAQYECYQYEVNSAAPLRLFGEPFTNWSQRTHLTIRVEPERKRICRGAMPRSCLGARTGR